MIGRTLGAATAAVGTALASALCCAGPLIAVTLGVSGPGIASTFEPLRPYLLGATALLLGVGFALVHREEKKSCEPGKVCADPIVRQQMKIGLRVATAVAVLLATFPTWSAWLL